MIYEFFTDKTTGPLTNFLSGLSNVPLRMIEYKILDFFGEYDVKRFTFGCDGEYFHLYLTKNDSIVLKPALKNRVFSKLSINLKQYNSETTKTIREYLLSFVRDHKLNQIVK